jgi:hypothetical protein
MPNDTATGFLILGLGIVAVLGLVFAVTLRGGPRPYSTAVPPKGVHLPPPSLLPVLMSVGAALLAAGLVFRPDVAWDLPILGAISGVIHPIIGPLGLLVMLGGIWAWVRAAGREWRDQERGAHDAAGH